MVSVVVFVEIPPPKIVDLAASASVRARETERESERFPGSSLDEGQDIRNLHLLEVAAAPSNFVADLPRIAECRAPDRKRPDSRVSHFFMTAYSANETP